jgi:hypothetical protein
MTEIECSADRRRLSPEERPAKGRGAVSIRATGFGALVSVSEGACRRAVANPAPGA